MTYPDFDLKYQSHYSSEFYPSLICFEDERLGVIAELETPPQVEDVINPRTGKQELRFNDGAGKWYYRLSESDPDDENAWYETKEELLYRIRWAGKSSYWLARTEWLRSAPGFIYGDGI